MIEVLRAGALTTVQDLGRKGLRHLGVTAGGALDPVSLVLANRLVGNPRGAACLEFGTPNARLRFEADGFVALCGADCRIELDGEPLRTWWRFPVRAGQTLALKPPPFPGGEDAKRFPPPRGAIVYLAVAGGIDVPPVMGSRATDLKSGFGGFEGRALRNGDRLAVGAPSEGMLENRRRYGIRPPSWLDAAVPGADGTLDGPLTLRVLQGSEYTDFNAESHRRFWSETWSISSQSNRMALRLVGGEGPPLARKKNRSEDLLSHGVLPGVIQVPPAGLSIVLMADAQTTGGYPKIGVVITADLPRLAQARAGSRLRFVPCELPDAYEALEREARSSRWKAPSNGPETSHTWPGLAPNPAAAGLHGRRMTSKQRVRTNKLRSLTI
ncbi:MAG: biotin-dependent carboxyltransferase family protein [Candidatus Protistobacter heckmanni]|nr:biotin-dependent carboxyltransferase family protein [Candidatus Protistobacter heckmanni]